MIQQQLNLSNLSIQQQYNSSYFSPYKQLKLSKRDFQFIEVIGNGSQGNVYLAKNPHFQQKVAMKTIQLPKSNFRAQRYIKRIESQIKINFDLQNLQNKNSCYFPKFYGYFKQNSTYYLIFQLCQKTSLEGYKKFKTYDQKYIYCLVLLNDMIKALNQLERKQILHRDIKPQNIMIKNAYFKLGDLGLAKKSSKQKKLTMDVGNLFSKSPQFYIGKYNSKSDIWSLGVTIFYLLQNKLPFDDRTVQMMVNEDKIEQYIQRMKNNQFFVQLLSQNTSDYKRFSQIFSIHQILQNMLIPQVQKRCLASQIDQKYFKQKDLDMINIQMAINQILSVKIRKNSISLNPINQNLLLLYQCLLLKYLNNRQQYVGVVNLLLMCLIKQITKINRRLSKLQRIKQINQAKKLNKNNFQIQILKNIRQLCFKLVKYCYNCLKQRKQKYIKSRIVQEQITSFGQIEIRNQYQQGCLKTNYQSLKNQQQKLIRLLETILLKYEQFKVRNNQQQEIILKKYFQELSLSKKQLKSVKQIIFFKQVQRNVLQQVQMNIQPSFQQILLNEQMHNKQNQPNCNLKLKQKSRKLIENQIKQIKFKLPKSLKYIQQIDEISSASNLDKLLLAFDQDFKLNQKFPLIQKIIQILKIITSQDKKEQQIQRYIRQQFRIWNLPLQLFRI